MGIWTLGQNPVFPKEKDIDRVLDFTVTIKFVLRIVQLLKVIKKLKLILTP